MRPACRAKVSASVAGMNLGNAERQPCCELHPFIITSRSAMDEHNVHHFWGISPGIDLGALATRPEASSVGLHDPIRLLQASSAAQTSFHALAPHLCCTLSHACVLPMHDMLAPPLPLQVASYDPRHTLTTLCRASRHLDRHQGPMQLYVHEEEPEVLARHVLLLSVMLDGSLAAAERMHALLELHGNVLLREKTADYLGRGGLGEWAGRGQWVGTRGLTG